MSLHRAALKPAPRSRARRPRAALRRRGRRSTLAAAAWAASFSGAASAPRRIAARRSGGELGLRHDNRAARGRQRRRVGGLVLVERVRERHEDRSAADDRKLGDGRGAGPADDEMGGCDPRRQIGEEFGDLDRKAHPRAGRCDPRRVLAPRLLGEADPLPLVGAHERNRRRNHVGHHPRALRTAGHENVQPPPGLLGIGKSRPRR